jgi:hypothetical protein
MTRSSGRSSIASVALLAAVLVIAAVIVPEMGSGADAPQTTVTGTATCVATTTSATWDVTWTVTNELALTQTAMVTNDFGHPVNAPTQINIPANGTGTYTQDVPGSDLDAEIRVISSWLGGPPDTSTDGLTVFEGTCAEIPTGTITVKKLNVRDQALAGAQFQLSGNHITPVTGTTEMPGGTVSFAGLLYGTYTVTETVAPSGYMLADPDTQTVVVDAADQYATFVDGVILLPQRITFVGPGTGTVGESATLKATGGASGNPVVFSVDSSSGAGVCSVSGTTVTYFKAGTCVIDANQAGNALYSPAPQVTQSITVGVLKSGYDLCGRDGGVFVFPTGQTYGFFGSLPGIGIHVSDIVGIVPTYNDHGYYLVGSDGGVFAFGNANFENSLPGIGVHVNDIVGIVPTSNDLGYFLVDSSGNVFTFGNAPFLGSLPPTGVHVNNIVGIAATANNTGYWLASSTGAVYSFGSAAYFGSANNLDPVSTIVANPQAPGYWLVTQNGVVEAFGETANYGYLPGIGITPVAPVIGLVPTSDVGGYWLAAMDGGVFAFGDAHFVGSLPQLGISVNNIIGAVATQL